MMEAYSNDYRIILNGTELLMNDKYLNLCNKYHQNFIYTNGMLLTKEKMNILKKNNINRISISLHYGIQEQISKVGLADVARKIKEAIAMYFNKVTLRGQAIFVTVYEGNKSGIGKITKEDCYQRNEPLSDYLKYFNAVFCTNDFVIKKGVITNHPEYIK